MELFRVRNNAWGQEVLEGVSWDLFWVFAGAALVIVIAHLAYMRFKS